MNDLTLPHGHRKISVAIFVGYLIIGLGMILAAEISKPPRYEYHGTPGNTTYFMFDNETGRSAVVDPSTKDPTDALNK